MEISSLLMSISFVVAACVVLIKNIKYLKMGCLSCEQNTEKKNENVNELENIITGMIDNIERLKNVTPKIKENQKVNKVIKENNIEV